MENPPRLDEGHDAGTPIRLGWLAEQIAGTPSCVPYDSIAEE